MAWERSKNFDRHMEALRRFTKSDTTKSEDTKKPGRKRITVKKPPKEEE